MATGAGGAAAGSSGREGEQSGRDEPARSTRSEKHAPMASHVAAKHATPTMNWTTRFMKVGSNRNPIGAADDDDDSSSERISGRDIPNWSEVVGMIIDVNMEARTRSPRGGGQYGRGRSAGPNYGRSRERDSDRGSGRRAEQHAGGPGSASQPLQRTGHPGNHGGQQSARDQCATDTSSDIHGSSGSAHESRPTVTNVPQPPSDIASSGLGLGGETAAAEQENFRSQSASPATESHRSEPPRDAEPFGGEAAPFPS